MASDNNATQAIDINPKSSDPFASQRTADNDPFPADKVNDIAGPDDMRMDSASPPKDRRMSREWDASKVPPSQFQKRKGSIYSTPGSRDGHVRGKDHAYHAKLKEKGWDK